MPKKGVKRAKTAKTETESFLELSRHVMGREAAVVLGVDRSTVQRWVVDRGAPRNEDGTYDLPTLIKWALSKGALHVQGEARAKEADRKAIAQRELIEERVRRLREETYPRSLVHEVGAKQIVELRRFVEESFRRNVDQFRNKNREQLLVLFEEYGRQMCEAFAAAGKEIAE